MIAIGRQTDYAARIVLHLASLEEGARVTAQEIAASRLIPPAFIRRIVSRLSAAGILITVRGNKGGVTLARPPSLVSLREVIEAMEGPIAMNSCLTQAGACPLAELCPVQSSWAGATRHLSQYLDEVRFDALAASIRSQRGGEKHGPTRNTRMPAGKIASARSGKDQKIL
jgi:Rrf2 family protein